MKCILAFVPIATICIVTVFSGCSKKNSAPTIATLTLNIVTNLTDSSATSGGNISSDGGAIITASGVCWNTRTNPTIALTTKTIDSAGSGNYTSRITGLLPSTTYYLRAYATNSAGTAYSVQLTFTTLLPPTTLTIGMNYGGGIIAYLFQPGDPGYSTSNQHGLIVANTDQSVGGEWWNGKFVNIIGANDTSLGAGFSNSDTIVALEGIGNYAAQNCRDYTGGGYNDWYLPSLNELVKLYYSKNIIGNLSSRPYWSSTQSNTDSTKAYYISFSPPLYEAVTSKNYPCYVRAVRVF